MKKNGLLAALVLIVAVGNVFGQWNRYSIGLGEIQKIATSQSGQTTFLILENQFPWLSTDGCETWNTVDNITDQPPSSYLDIQVLDNSSYLVSVDINNGREYYLSNDSGQSWSEIFPDSSLSTLPINGLGSKLFKIDSRVENRWVYSQGDGIGVSVDGGENWVTTVDYFHWRRTTKIWLESEDNDDIYLLGWNENNDNYGLINYSNDIGENWEVLLYPDQTDFLLKEALNMTILDNGTILVVVVELDATIPRILSSSNHGESWTDNGQLPNQLSDNASFFTSELYSGRLFLFDGYKILESTDEGQTWVENHLNIPLPENPVSAISVNNYNNTITVNTDVEGLYQTSDGINWETINTPCINAVGYIQRSIEFYEDGVFVSGSNGKKYFKSNDNTNFEKFTYQSDDDSTVSVFYHLFRNENLLMFYGYKKSIADGGTTYYLFTSENDGESFIQQRIEPYIDGFLYCLVKVYGYMEDGHIVAKCLYEGVGMSNTLIKTSTDFGETWTDETFDWMMSSSVFSIDSLKIILKSIRDGNGDYEPRFKLSYNGGETWIDTEIPNYENEGHLICSPVWSGNDVYNYYDNKLCEFDLSNGWEIYSTIRESDIINSFNFDLIAGDDNGLRFIGAFEDESEVYFTNSNGTEWQVIEDGLGWTGNDVEIKAVRYDPYRDLVWFSTSDALYSVAVSTLDAEDKEFGFPIHYELLEAYPNPFNPSTQIRYTIKSGGGVQLKVFDILGREVQNLVDHQQVPGYYTVNFDGSNLSSGTYLIHLDSPNGMITKKISLVK